jgi:hypothetical protein
LLRVDLHIHTHYSGDSNASPEAIVARCLKMGLNCIAITDHNTIQGALQVQRLAPFRVIIGEEIRTTAGELTGLFLREEIPAGLSPLDTVRAIKEQGGLVSIPHPGDRFRTSALRGEALDSVLPHADLIEIFNAHNLFASGNRGVLELARHHNLIPIVVSDAHTAKELGGTYMEMPECEETPQGFKDALARARLVTRRANPFLRFMTTYLQVRRLFG